MRITAQRLQVHRRNAANVSQIALHIEAVPFVYRFGSSHNERMY